MNINVKKYSAVDENPFLQSDRGATGAGKGDRPRNVGDAFKTNYELIDWGPRGPRPAGKQTIRYPRG